METNQPISSILDFDVRIARNVGREASKIYVYLTIWTLFPDVKIKSFETKDLLNHKANVQSPGILNLNTFVVAKKNSILLEKPTVAFKFFELNKENDIDFEFNLNSDFIFLINIHDLVRPEGTKRKVITYEDSDIIDETVL